MILFRDTFVNILSENDIANKKRLPIFLIGAGHVPIPGLSGCKAREKRDPPREPLLFCSPGAGLCASKMPARAIAPAGKGFTFLN
jgi:hypothetical protein